MERLVLDDPARRAAELLAAAAEAGSQIALTGGSTPRRAYELAAEAGADWSRATLWWGDERCVAPDDERSNFRLAREALLERLPGKPPATRRIEGELGPLRGAEAYEAALLEGFAGGIPRLDLVLLGVGPDAHCASLFPGAPQLDEHGRLAVGVERPGLEPWVARVSLTVPVLAAARMVVFLVTGADKADAVRRAFGEAPSPGAPASLVAAAASSVTVLLDRDAALG